MSKATNNVNWTTEQVVRGRWPVRIVVAVWGVLILAGLVTGFPLGIIGVILSAGLSITWYRGYNWARIVSGLYFLCISIWFISFAISIYSNEVLQGAPFLEIFLLVIGIAGATLLGAAGLGLVWSKNMEAYIWYLGQRGKQQEDKKSDEFEPAVHGNPDE